MPEFYQGSFLKNSVFTLALTMIIALKAPRLDNKCEHTPSLAT